MEIVKPTSQGKLLANSDLVLDIMADSVFWSWKAFSTTCIMAPTVATLTSSSPAIHTGNLPPAITVIGMERKAQNIRMENHFRFD